MFEALMAGMPYPGKFMLVALRFAGHLRRHVLADAPPNQ
jgi:hypothetical protein